MSASTESYAHGASDLPLIGETIGAQFRSHGGQPGATGPG